MIHVHHWHHTCKILLVLFISHVLLCHLLLMIYLYPNHEHDLFPHSEHYLLPNLLEHDLFPNHEYYLLPNHGYYVLPNHEYYLHLVRRMICLLIMIINLFQIMSMICLKFMCTLCAYFVSNLFLPLLCSVTRYSTCDFRKPLTLCKKGGKMYKLVYKPIKGTVQRNLTGAENRLK